MPPACFFVEDQRAAAFLGQQLRQLVRRGGDGEQSRGAHECRSRNRGGRAAAFQHRDGAEHGAGRRERAKRPDQSEVGHEHEPGQERARNAAGRVDRGDGANVAADPVGSGGQARGCGKRRTEQRGRHQQDGRRGDDEPGHHFDGLSPRQTHRPHAGPGLCVGKPGSQDRRAADGAHAGCREQDAEGPPWVVARAREAREEGAAEGQAREIRAQHHGKRVRPRAQELDEQLRPHDFVPQRHAAGDGIQGESGAYVAGWRSGGTFGPLRRHLRGGRTQPVEGQRGGCDSQADARGEHARPADAEQGDEHERHGQRARDSARGVRRVEEACRRGHGFAGRAQRPEQRGQRASHEERRCPDEHEGKNPGERPHGLAQLGKRRGRPGKREGGEDAKHAHAGFERGVQTNRARRPVGQASEHRAPEGQPREEGRERDRDGVHLHADDAAELLHPQGFEHERRRARGQQQRRERHRRFAAWP